MTLAYIALALVLSISVGALLSRWLAVPASAPRALEETTPLRELLRPTEIDDLGYCPAEERVTLHRFNGTGTRTCWTCRCETPTAVARG
ncbi:hypothetical protein ACIQ6R_06200 [Streptomyces sp. NPDC096048]|uniref:hypothetical protein n=1 Tax=Streptomyces sp. NPDC096048 TaxID=3366072 RepID=UPI0037FBBA34